MTEGSGEMTRKFVVPGKPLGKQRPRVLKNGITYTPQQTVNYEAFVKKLYWDKYHQEKPFDGPVRLRIMAFLPVPESASQAKKAAMLRNDIRPTKRPDWDNIGKIITDALNGLAYSDDKQIVSCLVEKYYSGIPRVEVEIEGM